MVRWRTRKEYFIYRAREETLITGRECHGNSGPVGTDAPSWTSIQRRARREKYSPLGEGETFLAAYARTRGRPRGHDEWEVAGASGLGRIAYNAKIKARDGGPSPGPGSTHPPSRTETPTGGGLAIRGSS